MTSIRTAMLATSGTSGENYYVSRFHSPAASGSTNANNWGMSIITGADGNMVWQFNSNWGSNNANRWLWVVNFSHDDGSIISSCRFDNEEWDGGWYGSCYDPRSTRIFAGGNGFKHTGGQTSKCLIPQTSQPSVGTPVGSVSGYKLMENENSANLRSPLIDNYTSGVGGETWMMQAGNLNCARFKFDSSNSWSPISLGKATWLYYEARCWAASPQRNSTWFWALAAQGNNAYALKCNYGSGASGSIGAIYFQGVQTAQGNGYPRFAYSDTSKHIDTGGNFHWAVRKNTSPYQHLWIGRNTTSAVTTHNQLNTKNTWGYGAAEVMGNAPMTQVLSDGSAQFVVTEVKYVQASGYYQVIFVIFKVDNTKAVTQALAIYPEYMNTYNWYASQQFFHLSEDEESLYFTYYIEGSNQNTYDPYLWKLPIDFSKISNQTVSNHKIYDFLGATGSAGTNPAGYNYVGRADIFDADSLSTAYGNNNTATKSDNNTTATTYTVNNPPTTSVTATTNDL
tara:strand:+ start:3279 stop:4805 length:1527 start_codon:yes stop_codon:yes gene_type:complete